MLRLLLLSLLVSTRAFAALADSFRCHRRAFITETLKAPAERLSRRILDP